MTTPDAPLTPTSPVPAAPAPTPASAAATPLQPVQPVAQPVVAKRGGGGRWVNLLLGAAALIAVGGVAFAIGRTTAPADAVGLAPGVIVNGGPIGSFDPGAGPQVRPGGPGFVGAGGPTIEGTVTAIDADSITLKLASGDEVTLATDPDTTYHESTTTDPSAVAVGDEVAVRADGGRFTIGGDGQQGQGADPGTGGGQDLTANDITVRR